MNIYHKLTKLSATLSDTDRENYKLLLSLACGGLMHNGAPPTTLAKRNAYQTAVTSLAGLQPHSAKVGSDGIVWRGRPDFLSEELLRLLQNESTSIKFKSKIFNEHAVASGEQIAKQVAFSEQLLNLISKYAGNVVPTGKTNYIYYDEEGMGIEPHIDNHEFPLNTILMLEHKYKDSPSALILYPKKGDPLRIYLQPGELIIFYADSVIHSREKMKKNESVRIVAFGFKPI